MELDNAGTAVKGYTVRITMYPWNEARDIFVKDTTPASIKKAAERELRNRAAIDKLSGVELKGKG